MANNRLYIINTETKEMACIAKNFGGAWLLGNKDMFMQIIETTFEAYETALIFVTENDEAGYNKYIANEEYKNINTTGKWENNW